MEWGGLARVGMGMGGDPLVSQGVGRAGSGEEEWDEELWKHGPGCNDRTVSKSNFKRQSKALYQVKTFPRIT